MNYIYAEKGKIIEYPYSVAKLRKRISGSLKAEPTDEDLAEYGVYPVFLLDRPAHFDPEVMTAEPDPEPKNNNGKWQIDWYIRPLTEIELTKRNEKKFKEAVRVAGNSLHDAEKIIGLALYAEIIAGGGPLLDKIKLKVFPDKTQQEISDMLEQRIWPFLEASAVALAQKIKDNGEE